MPKYDGDTIPCCVFCDSRNETKICKKCAIVYCKHFASTTDLSYCANCVSDFHISVSIMERQVMHEKEDGTVSLNRKSRCTHMTLSGNDWLFASHLIENMSDQEIEESVEWHRNNISVMLMEREARKMERYRKLAGINVPRIKHETQEQREKRETAEAAKAGKKTKVTKKQPTADDLIAMLTTLASAGYTAKQVADMMGKK